MKKTVLALTAALMLTGCARPAPTQPPTTPPTVAAESTEPPARTYYLPASPMERSTEGAVKSYEMEGSVTGLAMLGENLLVCRDRRTLYLLAGERMEEVRVRELEGELSWDSPDLRITGEGLAFYDAASATYVTLDADLGSGPSYVLSGRVMSQPLISSDFSVVYYATEEGIRRMDLKEGTSRMLRQEHEDIVRLDGFVFGDSRIYYTKRRTDGSELTCFVDAETGSLSRTNGFQGRMESGEERFSGVMRVEHAMGETQWIVAGDRSGVRQMLEPEPGWGSPLMLEGGRIVLQQRSKLGVSLTCVDLGTGAQLARVLMPLQTDLFTLAASDGNTVWLSDGTASRFYGWNLSTSGEEAPVAVLRDYAALSSSAEKALDGVRASAAELGEHYGITVELTEADNRTDGIDYSEHPDYRPMQYAQALERLRMAADRLPQGLLDSVRRQTGRDVLVVELQDRYDPAWGVRSGSGSFHLDGGTARITVDMCQDLESIFYHELFHVMAVQLRNDSDRLKEWESLNPEGFSYAAQEQDVQRPDDSAFPGGTPVTDGHAMRSAREDRAQVFMYACMDGQQERFASETMQRKLRFLSELLQDLYEPEEEPIWEQYLLTGPEPGE